MNKHVSSKDLRKKAVVAKLKQVSKGRKVTNVKEVGVGRFEGDCMEQHVGGHDWHFIGRYYVQFNGSDGGNLGDFLHGDDLENDSRLTAIPKGAL